MNFHWLLRMARWARNPPSWGQAKFLIAVLAICLGIAALSHFGLWPEWAKVDPIRHRWRLPTG